jgi:hypothetical protein
MNINFQRLLYTPVGKIIISILLGLGLSTMFYRVCEGKNCITFQGPVISEFHDKIFQHGDDCYKYNVVSTPCDQRKNIIDIASASDIQPNQQPNAFSPSKFF